MSRQVAVGIFARQHVQGGVLEGVIASGFEDEGQVEDHAAIIPPPRPSPNFCEIGGGLEGIKQLVARREWNLSASAS